MIIIDITNIVTILLMVIAMILLIFLAHEIKRSYIMALPLGVYLFLLVTHVIQIMTLTDGYRDKLPILWGCILLDFAFIFISFVSYLWIDDIEAKKNNKKSIDNSLDWFWKEV